MYRYGDKAPKGIIARILAVFWIMISTVFLALFTANATSILAISQAEEDHSVTLGKRVILYNCLLTISSKYKMVLFRYQIFILLGRCFEQQALCGGRAEPWIDYCRYEIFLCKLRAEILVMHLPQVCKQGYTRQKIINLLQCCYEQD